MWNFFNDIVCMNLDKRSDRWERMQQVFSEVGISARRFSCFTEQDCGGNRYIAYDRTYAGILESGKGPMLVTEDDIELCNNWFRLADALQELPNDWDVLYLGANLNGTYQQGYSQNLCRIKNALQSYAVAYSEKMRRWIVENYDWKLMDADHPIYDEWLRRIVQPQFNCFVMRPMIIQQVPGYSDLWEMETNYRLTFEQSNLLL